MVSGTNAQFLKTEVALPLVYERAESDLIWNDLIPTVQEETNGFMYLYDAVGKGADPKKQKPPAHLLGAQFPEVDKSRIESAAALIEAQGFSMRIPRNVLREKYGANEIMDCYQTAGYWMAEIVNTNILNAMIAGADTSFTNFNPAVEWDDAAAEPISDLMDFSQDMKREGYPFRLTDAYISGTKFHELKKTLTMIDVSDMARQRLIGLPTINTDTIDIPIVGTVNEVISGMNDTNILGIDRRNPAAELHYYNDPAFSIPTFSYQTNAADGSVITKTTPNFGFNFYQYEEDDTHDTILQFWVENKTVVKKPFGIKYGTGI